MKTCTKCLSERPLSDFYKKGRGNELDSRCKDCSNKQSKKTRANNESYRKKHNSRKRPEYTRKKRIKKKYGLTLEQVAQLVKEQNNLCAICLKPETAKTRSGKPKPLSIDHNHLTGKVRALLCHRCNAAIGLMDEDILKIESSISYLKHHNGIRQTLRQRH